MAKSAGKKALIIGVLCIATYLINYYLRNMLSVFSPQLYDTGLFTVSQVGLLSSVYMIFYAAGQLVNGFLGDFLSPKKIITIGVLVAGLSSIAFPFAHYQFLQIVCFAVLGFALSMFRGPLMKIISENTEPNHARTICVFFSFAGCAGPLIASAFALINNWMWSFVAAGVFALMAAVVVFFVFSRMESKGNITYNITKSAGISSIFAVFKIERVAFFLTITCVIEIVSTSVMFWVPTYLTSVLDFDNDFANLVYSSIAILRSVMPFVTLIIFRLLNEKDTPMLRVCFSICAIGFILMMFISNKWINLAVFVLALMAIAAASSLLWSIYIPSLGKTGRVSSVNGVLDCTGYIAASIATVVVAAVMDSFGWNVVFIVWALIGAIGLASTFFKTKTNKEMA